MKIAALTYVYNESNNIKIWIDYYGKNFGRDNLYIIDRQSNDGSTDNLGPVNKITVPRDAFDDIKKSAALSSLHSALLQSFDCVVVTDCDEIVAPDPASYENLRHYIEVKKPRIASCIGLNVRHLITEELPLDLGRPILSQRRLATFGTPTSKPLVSSVPTRWEAGGHVCDQRPAFDKDLYMFHLKFMDYGLAIARQAINVSTAWSERAVKAGHGAHHRYQNERFVTEGFLDPINGVRQGLLRDFDFAEEIRVMTEGMVERSGLFVPGDAPHKLVEIPQRFRDVV